MDHFHQIQHAGKLQEPMLEGWTTISVLAGMTTKLKFGTMIVSAGGPSEIASLRMFGEKVILNL